MPVEKGWLGHTPPGGSSFVHADAQRTGAGPTLTRSRATRSLTPRHQLRMVTPVSAEAIAIVGVGVGVGVALLAALPPSDLRCLSPAGAGGEKPRHSSIWPYAGRCADQREGRH